MAYTVRRQDLGHDAQPDWDKAALLVGQPLAAIAHKDYPSPTRWTIVGWRYIGTDGWVDVDSDGICYAIGKAHYPPHQLPRSQFGDCPLCDEPVYDDDEGPVWMCPADMEGGPEAHPAITEELREATGVFSNCGEDYGFPCYERIPMHMDCRENL